MYGVQSSSSNTNKPLKVKGKLILKVASSMTLIYYLGQMRIFKKFPDTLYKLYSMGNLTIMTLDLPRLSARNPRIELA